jgi:hypothetical protein
MRLAATEQAPGRIAIIAEPIDPDEGAASAAIVAVVAPARYNSDEPGEPRLKAV